MKAIIIITIIMLLELIAGFLSNNWLLSCTLLASTISIGLPIACYWKPDQPQNWVTCTYLSMIPGLGYAYLEDWKRAIPLLALFISGMMSLSLLTMTDTESEIEYVVISCIIIMVSCILTSVIGASRSAKERGIESANRNLELHMKDEGLAIRILTIISSIIFVWLTLDHTSTDAGILIFFILVWLVYIVLNLTLYGYWHLYDDET